MSSYGSVSRHCHHCILSMFRILHIKPDPLRPPKILAALILHVLLCPAASKRYESTISTFPRVNFASGKISAYYYPQHTQPPTLKKNTHVCKHADGRWKELHGVSSQGLATSVGSLKASASTKSAWDIVLVGASS